MVTSRKIYIGWNPKSFMVIQTQEQIIIKENLEREEMIQELEDSFTRNCEEF